MTEHRVQAAWLPAMPVAPCGLSIPPAPVAFWFLEKEVEIVMQRPGEQGSTTSLLAPPRVRDAVGDTAAT